MSMFDEGYKNSPLRLAKHKAIEVLQNELKGTDWPKSVYLDPVDNGCKLELNYAGTPRHSVSIDYDAPNKRYNIDKSWAEDSE